MVDALDIRPGDRILDSACGPGLWARMFAEKVLPTGKVVGLDLSADLLGYARTSLVGDALSDVIDLVQGDFHDPPFPHDDFDAVFLGNCLSYLSEADAQHVLRRHKDLVPPGGRVISKEFDGATVIFYPIPPALNLKVAASVARALEETPPIPFFDNFIGRKTYGMFRKAGFSNITTRSYAIQKVAPLTPPAKRYITGNATWYGQHAARFLTPDERTAWERAFDPRCKDYILDRDDFYFCMVETITIGTV